MFQKNLATVSKKLSYYSVRSHGNEM